MNITIPDPDTMSANELQAYRHGLISLAAYMSIRFASLATPTANDTAHLAMQYDRIPANMRWKSTTT